LKVRLKEAVIEIRAQDNVTSILDELILDIAAVQYRVAVLEQYAHRMALQYIKYSDGEFINFKRFEVGASFARQLLEAPNDYVELLMRKVFRDTLKEAK
jgi:hypothetical protein